MLCRGCYKEIKSGEEIQFKDLKFCKVCIDSYLTKDLNIAKCHNCPILLSNSDEIHEITKNWTSDFSERIINCRSCYKKWLKVNSLERKWSVRELVKPTKEIILIFQLTAVNLVTVLANKKALEEYEKGISSTMAGGIALSCFVLIFLPYIATFFFWLAEIIGKSLVLIFKIIKWILKKISNFLSERR